MKYYSTGELLIKLSGKIQNLEDKGNGGLLGSCPFHAESTPSFWVKEDGYYKCFGCDKGGSIKNLFEELKIIDLGINLRERAVLSKETKCSMETYMQALADVQTLLLKNVWTKDGREYADYLNGRGFDFTHVCQFAIGVACRDIVAEMLNMGYTANILEQIPCFKRKFGKLYFELSNQITFPIYNEENELIAFAGRSIQAKQYINFSNNAYFTKSDELYFVPKVLKSAERVFVVEGYFDVMSLAKRNEGAVATMGTHFSSAQVSRLKRLNKQLILAYDNDLAGSKANLKLFQSLEQNDIQFALITKKDVDEQLKEGLEISTCNIQQYAEYCIQKFGEDIMPFIPETYILSYLEMLVRSDNFARIELLKDTLYYRESYVYLKKQLTYEKTILTEIDSNFIGEELSKPFHTLTKLDMEDCFYLKGDECVSLNVLNDPILFFNMTVLLLLQKKLKLIRLNFKLSCPETLFEYARTKTILMQCQNEIQASNI